MDADNPREIRERGEDMASAAPIPIFTPSSVFRVCPPIERLLYRDIFDFFEMERIIDIYIYVYISWIDRDRRFRKFSRINKNGGRWSTRCCSIKDFRSDNEATIVFKSKRKIE